MMISLFLASLLSVAQPSDQAESRAQDQSPVRLTSENRAVIRCSAAFAIVGARQVRDGDKSQWPEIGTRGREFFVVAMAGMMDEHALGREQITKLVRDEAIRLNEAKEVDTVMPACLLMLQSSGI
ncbi:MAG: hypothetical protein WBA51_15035 [Erythrobacter sp.]